jgi:putative ABC transport system permease protein
VIRGATPDSSGRWAGVAVDGAAARAIFGTEDVIGRRIAWGADRNAGIISAVVGNLQEFYVNTRTNSRYRSLEPHIYIPTVYGVSAVVRVAARAHGDPVKAVRAVRRAIARVDRSLPINPLNTMADLIRFQAARERFLVMTIAVFGIAAFLVGAAGIFAIMAHSTAERRHEIGVRLALGARPDSVALLILRDAALLSAWGVAAGLAPLWPQGGF